MGKSLGFFGYLFEEFVYINRNKYYSYYVVCNDCIIFIYLCMVRIYFFFYMWGDVFSF